MNGFVREMQKNIQKLHALKIGFYNLPMEIDSLFIIFYCIKIPLTDQTYLTLVNRPL